MLGCLFHSTGAGNASIVSIHTATSTYFPNKYAQPHLYTGSVSCYTNFYTYTGSTNKYTSINAHPNTANKYTNAYIHTHSYTYSGMDQIICYSVQRSWYRLSGY